MRYVITKTVIRKYSMACTATLKRRHESLTNEQVPELPFKRRRFVPSQEVRLIQ